MTLPPGYALLPLFLVLVAIEAVVLRFQKQRRADAREVLTNLGTGVGQLALRAVYETGIAAIYVAVYELRLVTIPSSIPSWIAIFLATDLTYYAYHRLSHRVPFMWAWHGVHHQSTAYDLSISFRLSWLGGPIERLFYVPFALIGFPPTMIIAATGFSSFYQFFVHTRTVGRLGVLEWIFNTPSHHRVHHGTEAHYVDHNFGGVLCIWDRLFGTYVRERAEPAFGVREPFESKSPFVANTAYWFARRRRAPTQPLAPSTLAYVAVQWVLTTALVFYVVAAVGVGWLALASVAFAIAGTWSVGGLLDGAEWARTAEMARWTIAAGCVASIGEPMLLLFAVGSVSWMIGQRNVLSSCARVAAIRASAMVVMPKPSMRV